MGREDEYAGMDHNKSEEDTQFGRYSPQSSLPVVYTHVRTQVDSPVMRMKYSEVVWRTLPAVPLPKDFVARYANKSVAITGFEVDVLRRNNATGETESVPAYESYNHHYVRRTQLPCLVVL